MIPLEPCRISRPRYLRLPSGSAEAEMITVREHLAPDRCDDPALPLVLLTLHPGYAAGSYRDRDYFELLTPLLFQACWKQCRLRILTINHAGYDRPPGEEIDRFRLEPYSMSGQPRVINRALRHLLQEDFAAEDQILLVAYGHSMGGAALARTDRQQLVKELSRDGRQLSMQKILSAPAFALRQEANKNLGRLNVLHALKHSVGRMPLYDPVAKGLFRSIAPMLYRHDAARYSLNPNDTFIDFRQYDPFLLLKQGRELLQVDLDLQQIAAIMDGSHLFVFDGDLMVDSHRLLLAARYANSNGSTVSVQRIDAPHNAEREQPHLVAERLHRLIMDTIGNY